MSSTEIKNKIAQHKNILNKYGVKSVALFGSLRKSIET